MSIQQCLFKNIDTEENANAIILVQEHVFKNVHKEEDNTKAVILGPRGVFKNVHTKENNANANVLMITITE